MFLGYSRLFPVSGVSTNAGRAVLSIKRCIGAKFSFPLGEWAYRRRSIRTTFAGQSETELNDIQDIDDCDHP